MAPKYLFHGQKLVLHNFIVLLLTQNDLVTSMPGAGLHSCSWQVINNKSTAGVQPAAGHGRDVINKMSLQGFRGHKICITMPRNKYFEAIFGKIY